MRIEDFFEVEGLQIENGAAIISGDYDPLTPPPQFVDLMSAAPSGSIFIRKGKGVYQFSNGAWSDITPSVGVKTSIDSGKTLTIEDGYQYTLFQSEFPINGDLDIQGSGELVIHE